MLKECFHFHTKTGIYTKKKNEICNRGSDEAVKRDIGMSVSAVAEATNKHG